MSCSGDGPATPEATRPTSAPHPGGRRAFAAARDFTCYADPHGLARCWGDGRSITTPLALGDPVVKMGIGMPGPGPDAFEPICVVTGSGAVACEREPPPLGIARDVAVGVERACASLASPSEVVCWSLSDSSAVERLPIRDATDVAVNRSHACALTGEGRVTCWGPEDCPAAEVVGLRSVTGISARDDTCVVTREGLVHCWPATACPGRGEDPQGRSPVPGVARARLVSAGHRVNCAVEGEATVHCWPSTNGGDTPLVGRAAVPRGAMVEALAVGERHVCVLDATGSIACRGSNDHRQLDGADRRDVLDSPRVVEGVERIVEIAVGPDLSCARQAEGAVYCWGRLAGGDGWTGTPRRMAQLDGAALIQDEVAGELGVIVDGRTVAFWQGSRGFVPLYELTPDLGFAPSGGYRKFARSGLRRGPRHLCAHNTDGVRCTAVGGTPLRSVVPPRDLADVRGYAFCGERLYTVDAAGAVRFGFLDPVRGPRQQAIDLPSAAAQIACSADGVCARLLTGGVYCWTDPADVSSGAPMYPATPHRIPLHHEAAGLALGFRSACTWGRMGEVECWEQPAEGLDPRVLNVGTVDAPRTIPGITAFQVALSGLHTCALHPTGEVSCWGHNAHGQAGSGSGVQSPAFIAVQLP